MKEHFRKRKKLVIAGALGLAIDLALLVAVATLPAFDPEIPGSWCNLRVTAAVNEAYGTKADPEVIAMSTDGNAFRATTAVWTGDFSAAKIRFCREVGATTTDINR